MGSSVVIVVSVFLGKDPSFPPRLKKFDVKKLVTKAGKETFLEAILPRLAGFDVRGLDPLRSKPRLDGVGHELRPIIRAQVAGSSTGLEQLAEHFNDPTRANASLDIEGKTLSRVLVRDAQALHFLPVAAGVKNEVVGPDLIGTRCRVGARALTTNTLARATTGLLKAFQPPKPFHSFVIHEVSATTQKGPHKPITPAWMLRGQLA